MQQGDDAMRVAVRVLTAITEECDPIDADIQELHRLAPSLANASVDELACDVIQQVIKQRAEMRDAMEA